MNGQVKWFVTSCGVHLVLLALVLILTASAIKLTPPVSIDFTLSSSPVPSRIPGKFRAQESAPKKPVVPSVQPEAVPLQPTAASRLDPVPRMPASQKIQPTPVVSRVAVTTSETTAENVPGQVSVKASPPVAEALPGEHHVVEEKLTPEKAGQKYLKEHFSYIRDLIVKRLDYPLLARRMEWSGRVVLTFVVTEYGTVRTVRVKESSGYPVLDNSAVETVKSTAPFPRPPVAVEIIMPVQFRLQ